MLCELRIESFGELEGDDGHGGDHSEVPPSYPVSACITRALLLEDVMHRFFTNARGYAAWVVKNEVTLALPDLSDAGHHLAAESRRLGISFGSGVCGGRVRCMPGFESALCPQGKAFRMTNSVY